MAEPRRSESVGEPTPGQEASRRHRRDGVHDRAEHLEREVEHVREIAEKGQSEWTPVILGGGMLLILIPILALVMGIVLAVYYWVS